MAFLSFFVALLAFFFPETTGLNSLPEKWQHIQELKTLPKKSYLQLNLPKFYILKSIFSLQWILLAFWPFSSQKWLALTHCLKTLPKKSYLQLKLLKLYILKGIFSLQWFFFALALTWPLKGFTNKFLHNGRFLKSVSIKYLNVLYTI